MLRASKGGGEPGEPEDTIDSFRKTSLSGREGAIIIRAVG